MPDPSTIKPALTVDGQGIVLNLNGYTVECETGDTFGADVIKVVGTANTVMGPGTREYKYNDEKLFFHLIITYISDSISSLYCYQ